MYRFASAFFVALGLSLSGLAWAEEPDSVQVIEDEAEVTNDRATVRITADKPNTRVALIRGRAHGPGGTATAYEDVCIAPCLVSVEPGLREFSLHGSSVTPEGFELDLRAGQERAVHGEMGPFGLRYGGQLAMVGGLTALLSGGMLLRLVDEKTVAAGLVGGGAAMTVGGVFMWRAGRSTVEIR